ncbi:hypothetical protein ACP70R_008442 [Stipagrostis hirtigluma subsp. patula]
MGSTAMPSSPPTATSTNSLRLLARYCRLRMLVDVAVNWGCCCPPKLQYGPADEPLFRVS